MTSECSGRRCYRSEAAAAAELARITMVGRRVDGIERPVKPGRHPQLCPECQRWHLVRKTAEGET